MSGSFLGWLLSSCSYFRNDDSHEKPRFEVRSFILLRSYDETAFKIENDTVDQLDSPAVDNTCIDYGAGSAKYL